MATENPFTSVGSGILKYLDVRDRLRQNAQSMRKGEQDLAQGEQSLSLSKQLAPYHVQSAKLGTQSQQQQVDINQANVIDNDKKERILTFVQNDPELANDDAGKQITLKLGNGDLKGANELLGEYVANKRAIANREDEQTFQSEEGDKDRKTRKELQKTSADKSIFQRENQLRSQYNSLAKNYGTVRDSFARIQTAVEKPNAANDLAMIFSYMKLLDPTSVVRESEYANAENARGVPATIRQKYNKIIDGEKLDSTQRDEFYNSAKSLYEQSESIQKQLKDQYQNIALDYGIDADRVTGGIVIGVDNPKKDDNMTGRNKVGKYPVEEIK